MWVVVGTEAEQELLEAQASYESKAQGRGLEFARASHELLFRTHFSVERFFDYMMKADFSISVNAIEVYF